MTNDPVLQSGAELNEFNGSPISLDTALALAKKKIEELLNTDAQLITGGNAGTWKSLVAKSSNKSEEDVRKEFVAEVEAETREFCKGKKTVTCGDALQNANNRIVARIKANPAAVAFKVPETPIVARKSDLTLVRQANAEANKPAESNEQENAPKELGVLRQISIKDEPVDVFRATVDNVPGLEIYHYKNGTLTFANGTPIEASGYEITPPKKGAPPRRDQDYYIITKKQVAQEKEKPAMPVAPQGGPAGEIILKMFEGKSVPEALEILDKAKPLIGTALEQAGVDNKTATAVTDTLTILTKDEQTRKNTAGIVAYGKDFFKSIWKTILDVFQFFSLFESGNAGEKLNASANGAMPQEAVAFLNDFKIPFVNTTAFRTISSFIPKPLEVRAEPDSAGKIALIYKRGDQEVSRVALPESVRLVDGKLQGAGSFTTTATEDRQIATRNFDGLDVKRLLELAKIDYEIDKNPITIPQAPAPVVAHGNSGNGTHRGS